MKWFPVVAAVLVSSCGGAGVSTGASGPMATERPVAAVLASHCTDVVAADLGEGTLCVDSGFRPDVDQFSFENWGRSPQADRNVTVQTLIDLFGHSTVCMPGPETECVMRPRTAQKLDDWNVALGGGRCEGMATLSQRMFLRYETASEYSPRALDAADLVRADGPLAQSIVYWWATQFVPEVTRAAAESRTKSPLRIVDELIRGLANGVGHTVGMYSSGTGHSVTPFAVTRRAGDFVIHVYDNNRPGVRAEIVVSSADDTWSYENGRSGEESSAVWSGGTGTLEITPMSARQGPFTCPFCNEPAPSGDTVLTVTNQADAPANWVVVDAGTSGVIEQTAEGWRNSVEGATVDVGKSGFANTARISLPASVASARVELRHTAPQVSESVVTLRRPGMADIQVRNARSTAPVGAARVSRPVIEWSGGTTTVNAHDGDTVVSLAGATNLANVTVRSHDELIVSRVTDTTVEVSYKGAAVDSRVTVDLSPAGATTTELTVTKGSLATRAAETTALKVAGPRSVRFEPLPAVTTTTSTGSPPTTYPTIEVTLPG